jgi:uncharacterized membrane protein
MDDVTVARALHVVSIVLWIGGVGFVTTVLLPSVRRLKAPHERIGFFDAVERRFAWQARIWTVLAGLTGLYMLGRLDLWDRFRYAAYWWMHAMIAVWLLFTVVLFVAEPLFLHRWLLARAKVKPEATFRFLEWLHRVWLILSLVTGRRGRRHPRSAAVRMTAERGASAVVAPSIFQCAEPKNSRSAALGMTKS